MALVLTLLVLLVLTVMGAALMLSVNTETKISGHKVRDTQALTLAEAGVNEAILRIKNGDVPDDNNPRNVTLIYNNIAGSLPVSGADTTSLPTLQPSGAYLNYSTVNKTPSVLSLKYLTRGSQILRYDDSANPKVNTATGNAIWQVTSTGREGAATRTIVAQVTRSRFNILARAALAANVAIQFKGNINVCGHDHLAATPVGLAPPACDGFPNGGWWAPTAHGSCLPGAWTTSGITQTGSSTVQGEPTATKTMQTGFYSGPWDAMGMSQNDFWTWVGAPTNTPPGTPSGIYYLDNDNIRQNHSGSWTFNGGTGEGLLYADGDVQINGNFNFRGLIYAEGDVKINGDAWILGGLIVKGNTVVKIANGSATILYSSEAIQQKISKFGGQLRTIAWREL